MRFPPQILSNEQRIELSTSCRDCDSVPKVANAGQVVDSGSGIPIQIMHNGLKVTADCYYGSWMTELIKQLRGHHEAQEERIFYEVERRLADDATMIELGGFWAYYSLWFLLRRGKRRALVLEPDPKHLEAGRQNALLNGLSPRFVNGVAGGGSLPSRSFITESSGELLIPQHSVIDLMKDLGTDHLTLLHCDIQGAETEVLQSCRPLFEKREVDWVFVSTHSHIISGDPLTHQRCVDIIDQCGGIIEAEHDVHESFSGDGLIVARFCNAPPDWEPVKLSYNRNSKALFRSLAFDLSDCARERAELEAALRVAKEQLSDMQPSHARSGWLERFRLFDKSNR